MSSPAKSSIAVAAITPTKRKVDIAIGDLWSKEATERKKVTSRLAPPVAS